MWMIPPRMLCTRHLLGEHFETHCIVGMVRRESKLDGYVDKGLIEPKNLLTRHLALAAEIDVRGGCHSSPFPEFADQLSGYSNYVKFAEVDQEESKSELKRRCPDCKARVEACELLEKRDAISRYT